jgi:hypothetical protein
MRTRSSFSNQVTELESSSKLHVLRTPPTSVLTPSSTWRTLIPVLEDRPLALCDSRSVEPEDLVAADRIIPSKEGEVYYLTYNPNHKWYWLEKQTPSEPYLFVMYDTKAGKHARCEHLKLPPTWLVTKLKVLVCPHVSFANPRAPKNASPRESIETRSIVITEENVGCSRP